MKGKCFFIALALWFCVGLQAADNPARPTAGSVELSIRFFEKRIYYLGDGDHPILIEAVIVNHSPAPFRFKMASNPVFSFDFRVTNPANLPLEHSKEFTIARSTNQPVFFKEMSLEPEEKFGMVLSLSDFVAIEKPGVFSVEAFFHKEMQLYPQTPVSPIASQPLVLNVRPALLFPEEKAMVEIETGKLIQRESKPPDEVVAYTLQARQKSQWEKFFLYLDVERLYLKKSDRARSYQRMSEEERRASLEQFRASLKQELIDQEIVSIPYAFEILQTRYTPEEAEVQVIEKFKYPDYLEKKMYTYTLKRSDAVWIITDYEIKNLGTE